MPVPRKVRRAFQNQVEQILLAVDDLAEAQVLRALGLAEQTRAQILARLADVPDGTFSARHLRALRQGVDDAIADLVRRYQGDVPGLLERAHELGIDLAEEPLKAAATAAPGVSFQAAGGLVSRTTLEVLQDYSADLITNLGDEARRKINGILAQSALGTLGPFEAIQAIAGSLPSGSVFRTVGARAEAIYRTEVNRVFSIAAQARMNEMGERLPHMKKRWLSVVDSRTRATHISASGQVVPFDGMFTVGGEKAQFPRDPVLSAKESVNCRCHSVPVIDSRTYADLGVAPAGGAPTEIDDMARFLNGTATSTNAQMQAFEAGFKATFQSEEAVAFRNTAGEWLRGKYKVVRADFERVLGGEEGTLGSRTLLRLFDAVDPTAVPTLFRGMYRATKGQELLAHLIVGDTIDLPLASFSSSARVAKFFAGQGKGIVFGADETSIVFRLEGGAKALKLEGFTAAGVGEREWIASGRFVIESVTRRGQKTYVTIRQVGKYGA